LFRRSERSFPFNRTTADALISDKTFLTDSIKAAIIERAEHVSSDEESDAERLADVDDFEEDDWGISRVRVREGGSDEEEDENDRLKTKEAEVRNLRVSSF
jgi:hypothetical protein